MRVGGEMYNCGLGFIFYGGSVVGGVVNCLNDIYGGGIHWYDTSKVDSLIN